MKTIYNYFIIYFLKIKDFFKFYIFLDKYEKEFCKFNEKYWRNTSQQTNKGIILVELFPWYPLIYFWSFLINILSLKKKCIPKFYYFSLYGDHPLVSFFKIKKLTKIYNSFNVTRGVIEKDFKNINNKIDTFKNNFAKIKKKGDLINYSRKGVIIGDLIYDTYLRTTFEPTVNLKDERLKKIFIRSEKILDLILDYFKNNNVRYVVPSHFCYSTFGIVARAAIKKNIKVIKVRHQNNAQASFRLIISDKWCLDEPPYYNFKKEFSKFDKFKKNKSLKVGKRILHNRLSGKYDPSLAHMQKSQFRKSNSKQFFSMDKQKKSIIIFPHCFYDYPHRYRSMLFNDFYEQVIFILEKSKLNKEYNWFYKPHPHSLSGHIDIHKEIIKNYPNVKFIKKNTSHKEILKLNPICIITNHGTVAHEYAANDILAINTGDNPHINYNFSLTPKNLKQLNQILDNLDFYEKRHNINKKEIYEFMFMHNYYYPNLNKENYFLKDNYFATKRLEINKSSQLLCYVMKQKKKTKINIIKYIERFISENLRDDF